LLRNAVDAALERCGQVEVGWEQNNGQLDVWINDEGPGLTNTANLFVPFFTTKTMGSELAWFCHDRSRKSTAVRSRALTSFSNLTNESW
jgi:anti-sigma regulatory factor (Ser/Thr protein kinase)